MWGLHVPNSAGSPGPSSAINTCREHYLPCGHPSNKDTVMWFSEKFVFSQFISTSRVMAAGET